MRFSYIVGSLYFLNIRFSRLFISPILFEPEIPNLACGCLLGWLSDMYQFLGHCDLDLVFRIIVSGAYLAYYLRMKTQMWYVDASCDTDMSHIILGYCDLDL